jgi:excisionase family DNA binding protein
MVKTLTQEVNKMSKLLEGSKEIRNRLGVSESTFMDLVHNHELPAKKNGVGVYEITESDLEHWEKTRGQAKDFYVVPEKKVEAPKKDVSATPRGKKKKKG